MNTKLPKVTICARTWVTIANEVRKWSMFGKEKHGTALECVFYPLASVRFRNDRPLTPFDEITLKDVKQFTIGSVFIPPEQYTNYSPYAAGFLAPDGQEDEMQKIFTNAISNEIKSKPQLYFLGPGHSHPFSIEATNPSSTDINHHMLPYKRKNQHLLGFNFSLALIIVRSLRSEYCETRKHLEWQACAFALDENNQVQNLGLAEIKGSNDLLQPFYQSREGKIWESLQKAFLGEKLVEHERWPGGWTSFLIRENEQEAILIALPPRFPAQQPIKQSISLETKQAGKTEFWNCGASYKNYCLGDVNNAHYLKQG